MLEDADTTESLIPISIDIDIPSPTGDNNGLKIKDRFLWNAADPTIKPYEFAIILCDDIGIKAENAHTIAELIQTQIDEAQNAAFIDLQTADVTPDDVLWSDEDEDADESKFVEPDCRIIINVS
jgi:hypothetical protein